MARYVVSNTYLFTELPTQYSFTTGLVSTDSVQKPGYTEIETRSKSYNLVYDMQTYIGKKS